MWEQIGFFSGLGAMILFLGALALGRFTVTSIRDLRAAERARTPEPAPAEPVPAPVAGARAPVRALRDERTSTSRPVRSGPSARRAHPRERAVREEPVAVPAVGTPTAPTPPTARRPGPASR